MKVEMLINTIGEEWEVEFDESDRLNNIDGFLVTYRGLGHITLRTNLAPEDKQSARTMLMGELAKLPVNKAGVVLLPSEKI
jgi:hypothetical protein